MVSVETVKFGTVTVEDDNIINFDNGILGFERLKRFCLIPSEQSDIIFWLQAIDDPCVSMPCIDPLRVCVDYDPLIEEADLEELGIDENAEDVLVLCVMLIPQEFKDTTVNLAAPIVINNVNMKGKQVLLQSENYPVNLKIFTDNKEG